MSQEKKAFDLSKRNFKSSLWIDFKDKYGGWQEAEVLEMSPENNLLKIHINGSNP